MATKQVRASDALLRRGFVELLRKGYLPEVEYRESASATSWDATWFNRFYDCYRSLAKTQLILRGFADGLHQHPSPTYNEAVRRVVSLIQTEDVVEKQRIEESRFNGGKREPARIY